MKLQPFFQKTPAFFRVYKDKIFFVDITSQTLCYLENGFSVPFKNGLSLPFHPLFYQGCPYAFTDEGCFFDQECIFLAGGKQKGYGMDTHRIYTISKEKKEVIYQSENTLLGFSVSPQEKQLLIHESLKGFSFYEKTALILWDISQNKKTVLTADESIVTHYGFKEEKTPFFLTETETIVVQEGLDGFKRRPLGANNALFFQNFLFLLFTREGVDGLYRQKENRLEKIEIPFPSINEIFVFHDRLYILGRTYHGDFALIDLQVHSDGNVHLEGVKELANLHKNLDFQNAIHNHFLSILEALPDAWGKGWITKGFDPNKPTLIRLHGGPIQHIEKLSSLEMMVAQQQGFQIIYLNYRGSTGYGRNHRIALLRQYGIADVEDTIHLIKQLKKSGVKTSNIYIKGKSSAGLTAILSSLAAKVKKLAIYCPVTMNDPNDEELAYLFPKGADYFAQLCALNTPTILFQGDKDPIVTKENTEWYIANLKNSSLELRYEILRGVGHGTNGEIEEACLKKEFAFFKGL